MQNFAINNNANISNSENDIIAKNSNNKENNITKDDSEQNVPKKSTIIENAFAIDNNILTGSILIQDSKVQPFIFITIPSGGVLKFSVQPEFIDENNSIKNNSIISFSFPIYQEWNYVVELLDDRWFIFYKQTLQTSNFLQKHNKDNSWKEEWDFIQQNIQEINILRESLGYDILKNDNNLTHIAQRKLQDMIENQYIWHKSIEGKGIMQFVQPHEKNFLRLGENIAGGRNTTFTKLSEWIFDSPAHRYNLIFPAWKKIWIAIWEKDWNLYFVQVFSD